VDQAAEPVAAAKPVECDDPAGAAFLGWCRRGERRPLIQRSVRAMLVVAQRVDRDHAPEDADARESGAGQGTLGAGYRPSARRASGARTGALITRMPSERKTSSESRVNLLSRSRIRNRGSRACGGAQTHRAAGSTVCMEIESMHPTSCHVLLDDSRLHKGALRRRSIRRRRAAPPDAPTAALHLDECPG